MICNPNYLSDLWRKKKKCDIQTNRAEEDFFVFGLNIKDIWFTHHEGFSGMGHLYSVK